MQNMDRFLKTPQLKLESMNGKKRKVNMPCHFRQFQDSSEVRFCFIFFCVIMCLNFFEKASFTTDLIATSVNTCYQMSIPQNFCILVPVLNIFLALSVFLLSVLFVYWCLTQLPLFRMLPFDMDLTFTLFSAWTLGVRCHLHFMALCQEGHLSCLLYNEESIPFLVPQ